MKKCKGCGVELQDKDLDQVGYVKDINQDYCQRCFRLTHYGDINPLKKEKITNNQIKEIYDNYKNKIFILIVDCFDALLLDKDNLLEYFKNNKIIIVINKIDLLPRNITDDKINNIYSKVISKLNNIDIIDCFLTYKDDKTFNDFFYKQIANYKSNSFVFAGRVNAGKSTIINKLLESNDLTTSFYPGTTVMANEIKINGYTFIDTPGLNDEESYVHNLNKDLLKLITPIKTIKPTTFQLYENQTYFIEGIARFDIETNKRCNITFYIKNELNIHRGKTINAESYANNNFKKIKLKLVPFISHKLKVNRYTFIYLKGLGFVKINGSCKVNIYTHKNIKPYYTEVSL